MKIARHVFPFALPAAALAAWLLVAPANAQAPDRPGAPPSETAVNDEANDPPGRVGRIGELTGQVWIYHPDSGEWADAERNRPLTTGDRLATEGGGRAEVQIGSTTLRLDGGSEIEVQRLDDDRIALRLHSGSLATRLRSSETAREFELTTGEGRFTVQRTGRYRFDRVDEASHVTVYAGQALYEGPGSALTVNANQRAEFWLDAKNAAQYSITDPVRDDFAGWNSERDRADDRSVATRYVSPEMTGVEELDRYGRWEQSPEYGALWYPRAVAPGWVPYSAGRWAWVRPWGWTWVDDSPWGFAPFHYGRWVYARNAWGWAPGHYVRRPVYAPALVAWIGGPNVSLSLNFGGGPAVGWVPLAPHEVYVPGYRFSPRYARNVNITHVTNITNITNVVNNPGQQNLANRKFPHAVTVVPADVVASRRPVGAEARRWRDTPDARRLADEPTRVVAVAKPPVQGPIPARRYETTKPGGEGAAPRVETAIPAPPGRTRLPNTLRAERPTVDATPATPAARPATRVGPAPVAARPPAVVPPATVQTPAARSEPRVPSSREREPQRGNARTDTAQQQQLQRTQQAEQQARQRAEQEQARQRVEQARRAQQEPSAQAERAQQMVRQVQEQQAQQAQQAAQRRADAEARQREPSGRAPQRDELPQRQARGNGNNRAAD